MQQDQLAQSLIPFDAPSGLIARKVVGDGNCLYHATSLSLVGTMEYSIVLRILTAIELFENAHFYGNHPHFSPIFTTYPNCSEGICPLLHGLVKPRGMVETVSSDCLYILWSREGGLDSCPNAVYVPLFQEKGFLKVSHGPIKKEPPLKRSFCLEDFWFPSAAKKKKKNKVCLNSKKTKMGGDIEAGLNDKNSTEMDYEIEMKNEMKNEHEKKTEDELKLPKDGLKAKNDKGMEDERKVKNKALSEEGKKMTNEVEAQQEKELQYERKIEEEKKIKEERKMEKGKKGDSCSTGVEMDELKNTVVKRTRSFQWKWIKAHPWVRINILTNETAQPLIIPVPTGLS